MLNTLHNPASHDGLALILERISKAKVRARRQDDDITLIAVSKTQSAENIGVVLDSGQAVFGENYVQEAQAKWPPLRQSNDGLSLHMIGPLQSNKVNAALRLFDAIHTLDRLSLARKLANSVNAGATQPELFIQVNTGHEAQKAGIAPDDLSDFLGQCTDLGLNISGLMCIPPEDQDPVPHFRLLRNLANDNGLTRLSMGMSSDFEAAIAEGATHIRVGSAIFGERPAK